MDKRSQDTQTKDYSICILFIYIAVRNKNLVELMSTRQYEYLVSRRCFAGYCFSNSIGFGNMAFNEL